MPSTYHGRLKVKMVLCAILTLYMLCGRSCLLGLDACAGVTRARRQRETVCTTTVSTSPASRRRREAAAGEASPSLEKTVGEPSPWPDLGSRPLRRCLSGRSHSSLRRKVVGPPRRCCDHDPVLLLLLHVSDKISISAGLCLSRHCSRTRYQLGLANCHRFIKASYKGNGNGHFL